MGKLQIENGYLSQATLKTIYDEMDFQRATQAYLWALPAVGFHGLHPAQLHVFGVQDGEIVQYQTLKDKAGMLTPNLTMLYAMSFSNVAERARWWSTCRLALPRAACSAFGSAPSPTGDRGGPAKARVAST